MKYLRLHKCQDEPSFMVDTGGDSNVVDNSGVDNKKVRSLMETMQRVLISRARKNQSSEAAAESSGCTVVHVEPQKSIS
ncbi:hypothetical protein C2S51_022573 [Perilla frutescens var. frutescens]|nr:hypothetical protein C2S51_022573 [Perilla frutescens var. frutescens]